ncbi:DsbA family oxidoreductase [Pontibacillus yanchengensis]|uniref:DSBA oxidoreductase n=1 Tax=Pontibacillus yanchengensis Y32 TaxID=1385514 RepID=A0A0A2TF45_9BACI|nr:DsbA family oxidoreductase [Pontibacillus yanchengensis]KGP74457.1 DSBA oxidoreductase [Pontibacillus yanchengensis Y32]
MQIEVWSDFVCPFCYIGKRRLEEALAEFPEADQVDISFKSFELDPSAPVDSDKNTYERLAAKYGKSLEEAKQMTEGVRQQAEQVGLQFDFDHMIPTNTFDAHRLFQKAHEKGLGDKVSEKLFHAHFEATKHIGNRETLTALALEAGMAQEDVDAAFQEEQYAESVRKDEQEAQQIGVQGVPFFVFNRKFAISGAQPKEAFMQGLNKALEEEKKTPAFESIGDEQTGVCTDDGCD